MALTRGDLSHLPAGRDLDALIARRVTKIVVPPWAYPFYSIELSASRRVIEAMRRDGWAFRIQTLSNGKWSAWFEKRTQFIQDPEKDLPDEIHNAEGETEMLAVCRAAAIAKIESEKR